MAFNSLWKVVAPSLTRVAARLSCRGLGHVSSSVNVLKRSTSVIDTPHALNNSAEETPGHWIEPPALCLLLQRFKQWFVHREASSVQLGKLRSGDVRFGCRLFPNSEPSGAIQALELCAAE